jgi:hypothetical protein
VLDGSVGWCGGGVLDGEEGVLNDEECMIACVIQECDELHH